VNDVRLRGDLLGTCSDDGSIKLWRLPQAGGEGGPIQKLHLEPALVIRPPDPFRDPWDHPIFVFAIDISADARLLVSGGADEHVYLWNAETGGMQAHVRDVHDQGVYDLRLSVFFGALLFHC
jgi:WD40 repeat protein